MNKFKWIYLFLICMAISGCDEQLPSRNNPIDLFTGKIEVGYIYTHLQNGITFIIYITNNYSESFSEDIKFEGTLEIEWVAPVDMIGSINPSRTIKLQLDHLNAKGLNRQTNVLTINPQDTLRIIYTWDFKFDDSTDIRTIPFFRNDAKIIDCPNIDGLNVVPRVVFRNQPFNVKCSVKLFDKLATISIPKTTLHSCSINFWPDKICPPPWQVPGLNQTPCDLR